MGQDDATADSTNTAPDTNDTTAQSGSSQRAGPAALPNRYVALDLPQRDFVIYDRTNTQA